jgi:hypothetical protein
MDDLYCSMIHGGLQVVLTGPGEFKHCCLANTKMHLMPIDNSSNLFNNEELLAVRRLNQTNQWNDGCSSCIEMEKTQHPSFRQSSNNFYGWQKTFRGPVRLDITLDNACNLACQTCGPELSTFWQQHLKKTGILDPNENKHETYDHDQMIVQFNMIDLSELKTLVFCGGETLLGNSSFRFLEYIKSRRPDGDIEVCFQTNGTMPIPTRYLALLESFKLVKMNVSLDGIGARFNYLRWPGNWDATVANLMKMRNTCPVNVMFLIEQTLSIFNLYYKREVADWIEVNFPTNRLGDTTSYSQHFANGDFSLDNLSEEYVEKLASDATLAGYVPTNFVENKQNIKKMLACIELFDGHRKHDWKKVFPEVAGFYNRYIK